MESEEELAEEVDTLALGNDYAVDSGTQTHTS